MAQLSDSFVLYDAGIGVQVLQIVLDVDPSVAPGVPADEGSIAQVNNGGVGELYLKFGAANTDWVQLTAGTNIYSADGALSGNRVVTGFGLDLTFLGMSNITFAPVDFIVNTTGNVQFADFPNTRDDNATLRPANTLYTDANGNLLAVPGTVISEVAAPPVAASPFDAAVAFDTGTIPGVPIPYFWDGAAWLPFPAGDNIYTADGVLSGPRTVDGNSNSLTFDGLTNLTIQNTGTFAAPTNTVQLGSGGGSVQISGEIDLFDYPGSRDDTGLTQVENLLYTDSFTGYLQSAPIAVLISQTSGPPATSPNIANSIAYDAVSGDIYGWDGAAWQALGGGGPATNIYTADGVLSGPRTVDGGGNDLTFDNMGPFTVNTAGNNATFDLAGNDFVINNTTFVEINAGNMELNGTQILATNYPSNRDDTGTFPPENFVYTDAGGDVFSAPLDVLLSQTSGPPATPPNTANSIAYDAVSGDIYGWDGAAWQALGGGGPATNIYTADGTLTGNRVVDGGGANDLDFLNMGTFRVGQGASVNDIFLQGGDAFGPGTGGSLQLSFTAQTVLRSNNTDILLQANGGDYAFATNDAQFVPYPSNRDDTGADAVDNLLYTNGGGNLRSTPIDTLLSQTSGLPATSPNTTNSISYDVDSGGVYGWDSANTQWEPLNEFAPNWVVANAAGTKIDTAKSGNVLYAASGDDVWPPSAAPNGEYRGWWHFRSGVFDIVGGNTVLPTRITGAGAEPTGVDGTVLQISDAVDIELDEYCVVSDIYFSQSAGGGYSFNMNGSATTGRVVFRNCGFNLPSSGSIITGAVEELVFEDCSFQNADHVIQFDANATATNVRFIRCTFDGGEPFRMTNSVQANVERIVFEDCVMDIDSIANIFSVPASLVEIAVLDCDVTHSQNAFSIGQVGSPNDLRGIRINGCRFTNGGSQFTNVLSTTECNVDGLSIADTRFENTGGVANLALVAGQTVQNATMSNCVVNDLRTRFLFVNEPSANATCNNVTIRDCFITGSNPNANFPIVLVLNSEAENIMVDNVTATSTAASPIGIGNSTISPLVSNVSVRNCVIDVAGVSGVNSAVTVSGGQNIKITGNTIQTVANQQCISLGLNTTTRNAVIANNTCLGFGFRGIDCGSPNHSNVVITGNYLEDGAANPSIGIEVDGENAIVSDNTVVATNMTEGLLIEAGSTGGRFIGNTFQNAMTNAAISVAVGATDNRILYNALGGNIINDGGTNTYFTPVAPTNTNPGTNY